MFPDFVEFIASLNARKVRYLIVGGYAVAFHARPRATKDVDVLIEPTPANARRAREAIVAFLGMEAPEITIDKLTSKKTVLVLGRSPLRIDILTSLAGLPFRAAWSRRAVGAFGNERAQYIGLDDLVLVKELAGRPVDLEDARVLRKVRAARRR